MPPASFPASSLRAGLARAILAAACAAAAPPATAADPDPERGGALAERWCAGCHVVNDERSGADAGPAFPSLGGRSDAQLRGWVSEPHPPMPDLHLSGDDIDDIVAYIRTVSAD